MFRITVLTLLTLSCFYGSLRLPAQTELAMERLINQTIPFYDLGFDNLFKLATYTELKGRAGEDGAVLMLEFGNMATLTLYRQNMLLRIGEDRVFHLNKFEHGSAQASEMDRQLRELFDKIPLLNNAKASPAHLACVDKGLAKKNIEPFQKLYIRNILLRYGKYDADREIVTFRSDWLSGSSKKEVVRSGLPLAMNLSETELRGYFLESGATVFVNNVDRKVTFASGEQYGNNISAFKGYAQQLVVRTVHYVSATELGPVSESQWEAVP
ncbi:MAG: hypothetical protein EAZ89_03850, partial [Bacteroidetes bacterium]